MEKVYLKKQANSTFLVCGIVNFKTVVNLSAEGIASFAKLDNIVIDFTDLHYANSSIIALLLEWQKHLQFNNKTLQVRHLPKKIIELIKVSYLEKIIPLWNN